MSKTIQFKMFPEATDFGLEPCTNSKGSDRWYYLYKPYTDEMAVLDSEGWWVWTPRDTINNTPHLFNTRHMAQTAAKGLPGSVVTRYKWDVK